VQKVAEVNAFERIVNPLLEHHPDRADAAV
jgi:hypothetical protein